MTREEEIFQAAAEAFKVCRSSFVKSIERIWVTAFAAGAYWADRHQQNVWHDVKEEPNKPYPIIIEIDDDIDPTYEVITVDGKDDEFWKFITSEMDITRWAYIKDLLPKGGKE